jgi:hypothetical protein
MRHVGEFLDAAKNCFVLGLARQIPGVPLQPKDRDPDGLLVSAKGFRAPDSPGGHRRAGYRPGALPTPCPPGESVGGTLLAATALLPGGPPLAHPLEPDDSLWLPGESGAWRPGTRRLHCWAVAPAPCPGRMATPAIWGRPGSAAIVRPAASDHIVG